MEEKHFLYSKTKGYSILMDVTSDARTAYYPEAP
jgi:hypothetical protein